MLEWHGENGGFLARFLDAFYRADKAVRDKAVHPSGRDQVTRGSSVAKPPLWGRCEYLYFRKQAERP